MKKLIYTKGTEFEQNGKDLAIIDTKSRGSKPIMIDSSVLDAAILNGEAKALETIKIDDKEEIKIGFIVNKFNDSGNVEELTTVGMTEIANYFCGKHDGYGKNFAILSQDLKKVTLNEGIVSIGDYAFNFVPLEEINFPNSLESIGSNAFTRTYITVTEFPSNLKSIGSFAFNGNSKIKIKRIPESVTSIGAGAFYEDSGITQISVNVSSLSGGSSAISGRGVFETTRGLVAAWVGNKIIGMGQYAFKGSTALKKLFIDLPREKGEQLSGYASFFTNNTNTSVQIIFNDDEGFITREAFDAIDWTEVQ